MFDRPKPTAGCSANGRRIIITLKYINVSLKKCSNYQYIKKMVKYNGIETYIEVEMVVM